MNRQHRRRLAAEKARWAESVQRCPDCGGDLRPGHEPDYRCHLHDRHRPWCPDCRAERQYEDAADFCTTCHTYNATVAPPRT